jgi:hypothetical protein
MLPHNGDATDDGTNNRYVESLLRRKEGRKENLPRKLLAIFGANRGETKAYPEKMEANTEETEFEAVHQEVLKEDATVKPVGALKKRHRGRHLAAGRHLKRKEQTQGKDGCWKKLAATCRRMAQCAGVANCKGHCRQGHG